jgi:hypothetical protein
MKYQLDNSDNRDGLLQEALEFCETPADQAHYVDEELQDGLSLLRANLEKQSS